MVLRERSLGQAMTVPHTQAEDRAGDISGREYLYQEMSLPEMEAELLDRNCELHWNLTVYLVAEGLPIMRFTQVRTIFQAFVKIIRDKELAVADNPEIIMTDSGLDKLTNMPYLHTSQLKDKIMGLLSLLGPGRKVIRPNVLFKTMVRNFFPEQPSEDVRIPLAIVVPRNIRWRMSEKLSKCIISFVTDQPLEMAYICSMMSIWIMDNRQQISSPRNINVLWIKESDLYGVFQVSCLHRSQLNKMLHDQLTPVQVETD